MPQLGPDIARETHQATAAGVPPGPAPTGYALFVTGQTPFQYDWRQPPASRILQYHGDPNGELNAEIGSLCADVDTPALYQNTDGLDTWEEVGSGSAGGAPTDWVEWDIPSDEGPYGWTSAEQEVLWTDDITNATHGTAITLTSGHAEVAEDGWYTVYGYVRMAPVTTTAVYDFARLRLRGTSSPQFTIGSDFIDWPDIVTEVRPSNGSGASVNFRAALPFAWTGYLVSGSPIKIYAQMGAASDPSSDWEVTEGFFNMLKLPL